MKAGAVFSERAASGKPSRAGDGDTARSRPESGRRQEEEPSDYYLSDLYAQLNAVLSKKPSEMPTASDGIVPIPLFLRTSARDW